MPKWHLDLVTSELQVPSRKRWSGVDDIEVGMVFVKLIKRTLTGHADPMLYKNYVINQMSNGTIGTDVSIKDLRCGTGAKLINKVLSRYYSIICCMLAHDGAKHPKKIAGERYVEYKYDGVRHCYPQNGSATLHPT